MEATVEELAFMTSEVGPIQTSSNVDQFCRGSRVVEESSTLVYSYNNVLRVTGDPDIPKTSKREVEILSDCDAEHELQSHSQTRA